MYMCPQGLCSPCSSRLVWTQPGVELRRAVGRAVVGVDDAFHMRPQAIVFNEGGMDWDDAREWVLEGLVGRGVGQPVEELRIALAHGAWAMEGVRCMRAIVDEDVVEATGWLPPSEREGAGVTKLWLEGSRMWRRLQGGLLQTARNRGGRRRRVAGIARCSRPSRLLCVRPRLLRRTVSARAAAPWFSGRAGYRWTTLAQALTFLP